MTSNCLYCRRNRFVIYFTHCRWMSMSVIKTKTFNKDILQRETYPFGTSVLMICRNANNRISLQIRIQNIYYSGSSHYCLVKSPNRLKYIYFTNSHID